MTGGGRCGFVLVWALAGCSGLLGFDDAEVDSDGDRVADADDSCPDQADPDQRDVDGDGRGDVCDPCFGLGQVGTDADEDGLDDGCDPCPTGVAEDGDGDGVEDRCAPIAVIDEDGDGVRDEVDRCPVHPDPSQTDTDGDLLGDACDPTSGLDERRLFASFGSVDPTLMPPPAWSLDRGDLVIPTTGTLPTSANTSDGMVAQVALQLDLGTGEVVALRLVQAGNRSVACRINGDGRVEMVRTSPVSTDQIDSSPTVVSLTGPVVLRMVLTANQLLGGVSGVCDVVPSAGPGATVDAGVIGERIGTVRIDALLAAPSTARVRYLWVVDASEAPQ